MALSAAQKVALVAITRRTAAEIETATQSLSAETEAAIADEIDTWEPIKDSHVKVQGGSDGIDFDNERKRLAIRQRIMDYLGLVPNSSFFALGSATRGL